jgi:hypothetical protein
MPNRREFLVGLTALAGTRILTGCGGGDEAVQVRGDAARSASGSDASANAVSKFAAGRASPDGAAIPANTSLIDKSGNEWTVSGGVIYRNGATVANTYNVSLLLWYGARIYHCGTGGQFYVWTNIRWQPCDDPRKAVAAMAGQFFGMNGHYDYLYTPAQTVAMLADLGCTMDRLACTDYPRSLHAVARMAKAFQGTGISLFVCLNQGLTDVDGNLFENETVAYRRGYAVGSTIAGTLRQYGVPCTNAATNSHANRRPSWTLRSPERRRSTPTTPTGRSCAG